MPLNQAILELAAKLIVPGGIPKEVEPDAVHITAAEYLITWNLRHIANAHIRRTVERILVNNGYPETTICTPDELF